MSIPHVFDFVPQEQADLDRYDFGTGNTSGSGHSASFATNPDSALAHSHYKVLKLVSPSQNNDIERAVRLRGVETGGVVNPTTFEFWQGVFSSPTAGIRDAHTGSYYLQFRVYVEKGSSGSFNNSNDQIKVLKLYAGGGGAIDSAPAAQFIMVGNGSGRSLQVYLNNDGGGTGHDDGGSWDFPLDTTCDIRMRYKPASSSPGSDGELEVWARAGTSGAFTQIVDVSDHDSEDDIHWIAMMSEPKGSAGTGDGAKVYHGGMYTRLDGFEANDYEYRRFLGTALDVSDDAANFLIHVPDNWVDTTAGGVRVEYSTDSSFASYDSTAYSAYSGRSSIDTLHIRATGLDADTTYHYRYRFVDNTSSPTDEYVSPARSFKTLGAAGVASTRTFLTMGCNHDAGWAGNNEALRAGLAAKGAPDFIVWQGDTFYDDAVNKLAGGNSDYHKWKLTEAEYKAAYMRAFSEYDNDQLFSQAAVFMMWDDHEMWDNSDGNMRGNASNMGVAVANNGNAYGTSHIDSDYLNGGASVLTANEAFELAAGVAQDWWGAGTEGAADEGTWDYYRAIETGKTLIPILDTRTRSSATDLIPSAQETWLQTTVSGSSARYVFLASQSVWRDDIANTGFPENWGTNNDYKTQRDGIFSWLESNASDKIIYGLGNDRHCFYMGTLTGDAIDSCLKYEIGTSPGKSYRWYDTSAITTMAGDGTVLDILDTSTYPANSMVRTSGVYVTVNESTGQIDAEMYDHDGTLVIDQSHSYPQGGNNMAFWYWQQRMKRRREREED